MELVMPVLPSRAVPSAPCWESRLELLGTRRTQIPQHSGVPEQRCPEDARCVSWLSAGQSEGLPGPGQGEKRLLELCKMQSLAVDWQNKVSLCGSGRRQRSCVCERLQPGAGLDPHPAPGWSWGRSEPPAPASPALPARMDALTQLFGSLLLQTPARHENQGWGCLDGGGGSVWGLFSTQAEPLQPFPEQHKTTQGIPGGVNRARLSC